MSKLPDIHTHEMGRLLADLAFKHGFFIRGLSLVYYDGLDEYLTHIKQLETVSEDGKVK